MNNGTGPGGAQPSRMPREWVAAALRRERTKAGISLSELAKRAGIAKSTLSQLEAATGNPGIETIWALAVALGVPFSVLVESPAPAVTVIRAGEGPTMHAENSSYAGTLLSAGPTGVRRDIYHGTLEPGAPRESDPHIPGSMEHLVISTGRLLAGPRGETVELGPGDYMSYRGDVPHSYEALEPGTMFVMVMQHV
ncbi:helix-turn-helix domain-containing protein [Streptomyces rochei]|uniref:helix-turn-helix domain-containing protein n=1 Tax=Streptomyces TaxID=1883 RepID=UPI000FAE60E5|nr:MULTISPECIES: XRE family transcriptional regulator [unclassified Streptomyces]RSS24280.1 XRE family transcriptional regulator [Streptomyces sp. WAC08452]RSS68578.1 XRE family transcriptional regulator [Streptomyces sp. WAC06128]GGY98111.1 XRE family transcriptional regulator [Streptomyces geysiriensis]